jgi:hypothetical protein
LTARVVHIELQVILREKPIGDSTAPKYLPFVHFRERDVIQTDWDDTAKADLANQAILQSLAFQPFASVRQIFRVILLSKSTGSMHLSESFGFISERLRCVPHRLSDIEKEARVEKSEDLLQQLLSMKHQSWNDIVTLDEAWYVYVHIARLFGWHLENRGLISKGSPKLS